MSGKHIDLFLVDGESGGITTAGIIGWTGQILNGPRSALTRLLDREEARRNGVYFLLGDDPDAIENIACYIGRTEDFSARFRHHDRQKDWWDRAILVSSLDDSFNEGYWGYLESRLLEIARTTKRCTLRDNVQAPQPRKLSEAQQSDAEAFLEQIRSILPVLGVNILRGTHRAPERQTPPPDIDSPIFTLTAPKRGVKARARVVGASSSCWKDPESLANGPMRAVSQVPATPTETTGIGMPNSSMTEVSLSREKSALSHGTSPSPHHPPPVLLLSATPATAVSPGPGRAAPTRTGRTGPDRWFHHPRRFSPTLTKASSHDHS